jgi:hypothetical protein
MREDLVEDTPLLRRAGEILTAAARSPRLLAGSMAEAARITVAEDITARALDSVSASMHLTDTPLRSVIPPDSMMQTACGSTLQVALCRTDIDLSWRTHSCVPRSHRRKHSVQGWTRLIGVN